MVAVVAASTDAAMVAVMGAVMEVAKTVATLTAVSAPAKCLAVML